MEHEHILSTIRTRSEWAMERQRLMREFHDKMRGLILADLLYQTDDRGVSPYGAYKEVRANISLMTETMEDELHVLAQDVYIEVRDERGWR